MWAKGRIAWGVVPDKITPSWEVLAPTYYMVP